MGGDEAVTAAQHAAGRMRQGHLAFAPVLRPDTATAAGSAAAGGSAEALERKRNADGSVKIAGVDARDACHGSDSQCNSWLHAPGELLADWRIQAT